MNEKQTWIYLLRDRATGLYKIGQSVDPVNRLKTLCKQDTLQPEPNAFEMIEAWWGVDRDERELHRNFADQRRRGEWFELDDEQVAAIGLYFAHTFPFSGRGASDSVTEALAQMWHEMRELQEDLKEQLERHSDHQRRWEVILAARDKQIEAMKSMRPEATRLKTLPSLSNRREA